MSRSSVRTSPISSRYCVAQPIDEAGGVLDVGHQHGEEAGRQRGRSAGTALPEGALRVELAGDEAERHDPVLLGGVEQPLARSLAGRVVLEVDLVEPGERVADVGGVVDRKPSPTPGVDVGERPIREVRPFRRLEPRHGAEGNDRAARPVGRIRPSRGDDPARVHTS